MSDQQSTGMRSRRWLCGLHNDADPENDDGLTERRLKQWRPFWQNPFTSPNLGLAPENKSPQVSSVNVSGGVEEIMGLPEMNRNLTDLVSKPGQVMHSGPIWINLFYDLAWTAAFSTLTQNGGFDKAWDSVSYATFFMVMWWLWASQTLYSIHFYTNDWFHLLSTFVQLVIFGLLAATTRGYDVTNYISKSPGADTLDPQTIDEMTDPKRYLADKVASCSIIVIAFSLAVSRFVHWLQHMLVWVHARRTARGLNRRIPLKLCVLPFGLAISSSLFWAAAVLIFLRGKEVVEARLKFALWSVGLLAELVLHGLMESLSWGEASLRCLRKPNLDQEMLLQPESLEGPPHLSTLSPNQQEQFWPVPQPNVNPHERLKGITTVILGEGLNGIAGSLCTVISAPGVQGPPVAISVTCTAIIVYLLAYFYFEGPIDHQEIKGGQERHMVWLLLYFPFMLCIILLLLGVKNQFLFTSFLSSAYKALSSLNNVMPETDIYMGDPAVVDNLPMKNFLLKRGLEWQQELKTLIATVTLNGSMSVEEMSDKQYYDRFNIWYFQMSLKIMVGLYTGFMGGNEKIDSNMRNRIQDYYTNYTIASEDYFNRSDEASSYHYVKILSELLDGYILGARHITALAGIILISLGIMNQIDFKPRDRFQWGVTLSRISMGFALLLLLLLNLGDYQELWVMTDYQSHRQAGVLRWTLSLWVLPTLAVAFGIEFVIELILLRCAGLAIVRKRGRLNGPLWRAFFRKAPKWSDKTK